MEDLKLKIMPVGYSTLDEFLQEAYPADIADFITRLDDDELIYLFSQKMSLERMAEVIGYLEYDTQHYLANFLSEQQISDILSQMYSDDAADFLGSMPVGKVKNILNMMRDTKASELQRLLGYDDESAGGIMTTEYLAFYSDLTAADVLEKLRKISPEAEMIYYIYIISRTKDQGTIRCIVCQAVTGCPA